MGGALLVTLNQHGYHSILQRHAISSGLCLVGPSFVFQQDNDPKHTSKTHTHDFTELQSITISQRIMK